MTSPESKRKEIYPGTVDFSLTTDGSEATLKFGSFQHTLPHERLDKSVGSNPSVCSNLYVGNLEYNTVSEFSQVENLRIRSPEVPLITVKRNSEATPGEPVFEVTADDGSEVQLENNKITVNGVDHHLIWGEVMPKEFNALNEDQIKDYLGNIPNPEDLAFLIMAPIIKEDANSQELNRFMTDKEQEVKGRLILEISRDLLGFIAGRSGNDAYKTEYENIVVRMMQSGLGGKYLFTQEGQTDFRMICLKLLESGEASNQLKRP